MSPLFRLSFAFAFNHNMAHSVSMHRKALCGIPKSETLASECDPGGIKGGVGEGCQCGTRCGEGRDMPQDSVSHRVHLQHNNRIRGEPTSEPRLTEKENRSNTTIEEQKKQNNKSCESRCVAAGGWH